MDASAHVWIGLAPGLAILAAMLLALAAFSILEPTFDQPASRTSGSLLLPKVLIRYAYWLSKSVIEPMGRLGIRPNHVTALSVVLSAVAAALVADGRLMAAAWVLLAAMACDLLDGLLARSLDMQTDAGAFFDSFCDRAAEGLVFAGLAYYGRHDFILVASLAALITSYLVSYARGRAEGLGVDCKVGLMQRPERLLVLFFALLAAPVVAAATGSGAGTEQLVVLVGVSLLAVLTMITAVRRALWVTSALSERDGAVAESATPRLPEASS